MVNRKTYNFQVISILLFLLLSCSVERFPYDKSLLRFRKNYASSSYIKVNGVYLKKFGNDDMSRRAFFPDGYYYYDAISMDSLTKSCVINTNARFIPYGWGVYYFRNDTLIVHRVWGGGRDKFQMFKSEELKAKVLNDTTLLFFWKKNIFNEISQLQDTFHFRKCEQVPSSFNILMRDE